MAAARPNRAYLYAAICTAGSVLGGILGYAIGFYLADFGHEMLNRLAGDSAWSGFQREYAKWGVWVILIKGLLPIPYKIVTIASGLAHFSFPVFVAASIITRGGRFFGAAAVLKRCGPQIMPLIERRLYSATAIVVVLLLGGFLLVKLVFHG
jgi:membrane protein YqaA with SNARE-associated domain